MGDVGDESWDHRMWVIDTGWDEWVLMNSGSPNGWTEKKWAIGFPNLRDDPALLRVHVIQLGDVNYCFIYARIYFIYCIYIYIQYIIFFKT